MSELERPDPRHLGVLAEIAPVLEQLDGRALVVLEGEHLADAGNGVVAQLALDAVLAELARESPKSEFGATSNESLAQRSWSPLLSWIASWPILVAEKDAVLLPCGDRQAQQVSVIARSAARGQGSRRWRVRCA